MFTVDTSRLQLKQLEGLKGCMTNSKRPVYDTMIMMIQKYIGVYLVSELVEVIIMRTLCGFHIFFDLFLSDALLVHGITEGLDHR